MTTHQARRFWILFMPVFLTGIALIAHSVTLTPTTNGLTVLGALVALAGISAAAYDGRSAP